MKKHLDAIGRKVTVISARNSKVRTGDLRDSQNWRVKPFNVLTVTQNYYGKYNTPKGHPTPKDRSHIENTPLLNSIRDNVPDGINLLVKDMIDLLASPVQFKK